MKDSPVRQKIVETATRLFYEKGYNLTGINEIIKEAEIAKATLYHHFKSKEDICLAYLHYKNDTFTQDISAFVDAVTPGQDQILALFGFLRSFFHDKDFNGCWCLNTISELPKGSDRIREEIQAQKAQLIRYIGGLVAKHFPELGESKQGALARKIYLLYEGALSESHLHGEPWPIEEAEDLCRVMLQQAEG